MKLRMKIAAGGLALTGALLGGGAAAMAQTSATPSTTAPTTTAPATSGSTQKPDSRNCPNMGTDSAPAAPSGASTSSQTGV